MLIYLKTILFFVGKIYVGGPGLPPKNIYSMKLSHNMKLFKALDDIFEDIECS